MNKFSISKSLGSDGWMLEIFLEFFDLMGGEILEMVEISKTKRFFTGTLNSTFITLMPKRGNPINFQDFRLISLCNLVYNITTKIICSRLKSKLVEMVTKELFSFLSNRQVLKCCWNYSRMSPLHQD